MPFSPLRTNFENKFWFCALIFDYAKTCVWLPPRLWVDSRRDLTSPTPFMSLITPPTTLRSLKCGLVYNFLKIFAPSLYHWSRGCDLGYKISKKVEIFYNIPLFLCFMRCSSLKSLHFYTEGKYCILTKKQKFFIKKEKPHMHEAYEAWNW